MHEKKPRQDIEIAGDDTEDVPFSPQVHSGFGTKDVAIGEHEIEIHETHRLFDVITAHIQPSTRTKRTQEEILRLSQVYGPRIKDGCFEPVLERLRQEYPKLHAKIVSLIEEHYDDEDAKNEAAQQFSQSSPQYVETFRQHTRSVEYVNLREYFLSKFFDALAIIGPEVDLEAPLSQLCED